MAIEDLTDEELQSMLGSTEPEIPTGIEALSDEELQQQAPLSTGDKLLGGIESFANAVTLGLGDELSAAEQAIFSDRLPNEDFVDAYNRHHDVNNRRMDKFAEDEPLIDALAGLTGTIGTAALAPARVLPQAVLGAVEGFGREEGGVESSVGGLTGGALTGAFGTVSRAKGLVSQLIFRKPTTARALGEIDKAFIKQADDLDLARAQVQQTLDALPEGDLAQRAFESAKLAEIDKRVGGMFQGRVNAQVNVMVPPLQAPELVPTAGISKVKGLFNRVKTGTVVNDKFIQERLRKAQGSGAMRGAVIGRSILPAIEDLTGISVNSEITDNLMEQ